MVMPESQRRGKSKPGLSMFQPLRARPHRRIRWTEPEELHRGLRLPNRGVDGRVLVTRDARSSEAEQTSVPPALGNLQRSQCSICFPTQSVESDPVLSTNSQTVRCGDFDVLEVYRSLETKPRKAHTKKLTSSCVIIRRVCDRQIGFRSQWGCTMRSAEDCRASLQAEGANLSLFLYSRYIEGPGWCILCPEKPKVAEPLDEHGEAEQNWKHQLSRKVQR